MQVVCDNRARDNLRHIVVLAAALGGLSLGGCTEKPDSHVLKPDGHVLKNSLPAIGPRSSNIEIAHLPPAGTARPLPQKQAKKAASFDPARLVGLEPGAIGRMLGKPVVTRTEATTVEWTYKGPGCSLRIFFYPDITTGALRALQYYITDKQAGEERGCVNFPMIARRDESD